jgi:hypothetical protein
MEEMEVQAYLKLMDGMRLHYGFAPEHLRLFSVHYEADKDQREAGHELIDRLVTGTGREEECFRQLIKIARRQQARRQAASGPARRKPIGSIQIDLVELRRVVANDLARHVFRHAVEILLDDLE